MIERRVHHVRMAKADPAEVDALRVFMETLEEKLNQGGNFGDLGKWVFDNFPAWRRTIEGYSILIDNACDPALSYLDWKPELKQFVEAQSKGEVNQC